MAGILDYLYFRKDLSFQEKPLNSIDILILNELSYVDWDGIVTQEMNLLDACRAYRDQYLLDSDELAERFSFSKRIPTLVDQLCDCTRYENVKIKYYQRIFNQYMVIQFGAVTFKISEDTYLIAFGGTDNTVLGWKEDFEMTYMDAIPSQKLASEYLRKVMERIDQKSPKKGLFSKPKPMKIYLSGHSKGGNLAMYAFLKEKALQSKIERVYNFDGPGFRDQALNKLGFDNDFDKIVTYIPESSIIGRLLTPIGRPHIVCSDSTALSQHDAFNWHVGIEDFVYTDTLDEASESAYRFLLANFLSKDDATKEQYTDAIFSLFNALQIEYISQLNELTLKQGKDAIVQFTSYDAEEIKFLLNVIKFIYDETRSLVGKKH